MFHADFTIIAVALYVLIIAIAYRPKPANVSITINYFPEVESEPATEEPVTVTDLEETAIAAPSVPVVADPWLKRPNAPKMYN